MHSDKGYLAPAPATKRPSAAEEVAEKPVMVAYLYQRPGTPAATKALLRSYIEDFAEAQGLVLDSIFVGIEGDTERFTISDLLTHVVACGASVVVVTGPAYQALQRLRAMPGLQVLTLADTYRRIRTAPA